MKTMFVAACCGVLLLTAGCVNTVNDRTTPGVPFIKDRVEGEYERSVDQVFAAARDVVARMGTLANESTLYNQTNTVKTIQGKVDERGVWIRVEGIDPKPITLVVVQARTKGGGVDLDLAHEIEKQIALQLAAAR